MAYQPLYATITDTNSTRHTTSLRGRVEWVKFWLNSHFGEVLNLECNSNGEQPKKNIYFANSRINYFKGKNNNKKVLFWENRLKEWDLKNKELEKSESVIIDIKINKNPKFHLRINDIEITHELLNSFKKLEVCAIEVKQ